MWLVTALSMLFNLHERNQLFFYCLWNGQRITLNSNLICGYKKWWSRLEKKIISSIWCYRLLNKLASNTAGSINIWPGFILCLWKTKKFFGRIKQIIQINQLIIQYVMCFFFLSVIIFMVFFSVFAQSNFNNFYDLEIHVMNY